MTTLKVWRKDRPCQVIMGSHSVGITCINSSRKQATVVIAYSRLLAVRCHHGNDNSCHGNDDSHHGNGNSDNILFTIHYARRITRRRQRVESVHVHADQRTCEQLTTALEEKMAVTERPRRLVVIINPNSGKKRGEEIFHKQVRPLFTLCGIDTRVVVTTAPKQARDILQTMDLDDVDGLVTVGGDGLYCEVMTGLLTRTQADHGVNVHDSEVKIVASRLPIGLIPAGTTSMMVRYLHGTRDVTTAALQVALGRHVATNAVSLHQGARLSAYAGLVLGFGLQGDMMASCERFRWMGARRYDVIPIGTVLGRRCHRVQVDYQDVDSRRRHRASATLYGVDTYVVAKEEAAPHVTSSKNDTSPATPPTQAGGGRRAASSERVEKAGSRYSAQEGPRYDQLKSTGKRPCASTSGSRPTPVGMGQGRGDGEVKDASGKRLPSSSENALGSKGKGGRGDEEMESGKRTTPRSSESALTPKGKEGGKGRGGAGLRNVFGAEAQTVYLTHKCSLYSHVQQLAKLKDNASGAFDFDFVQKARVESYTVRLLGAGTVWQEGRQVLKEPLKVNCDGEVLRITEPEFHVRLHRHAIRLYGEAIA
ncbi:uncharacterized protein LOC143294632 [Babylonia areolata]|uniref:uncharacterized protein LOC143294632 n=1 Tax=Babylonia areolata TaxID=304850 RepID=UPI003FD2A667